ncbi:unnamed protein product [Caenorhabditis nigoni]
MSTNFELMEELRNAKKKIQEMDVEMSNLKINARAAQRIAENDERVHTKEVLELKRDRAEEKADEEEERALNRTLQDDHREKMRFQRIRYEFTAAKLWNERNVTARLNTELEELKAKN